MNRYGQSITWGPSTAPALFTGSILSYSYRDARTRQLIEDATSDYAALVQHSQKADINFEARITEASTDFLDLSMGAKIVVSGVTGGTILATRAIERWQLLQPKTASIQATHYPDMTGESGASAGATLGAFTPDQSDLDIVLPGGELIYGTYGLGHAAGVVHGLTLEQQLTITEDDPSPDGKILGAASHAYLRTIQLDLLATGAIPATGTVLGVSGGPDHASGYRIESAELKFTTAKGKMYALAGVWIPALEAA